MPTYPTTSTVTGGSPGEQARQWLLNLGIGVGDLAEAEYWGQQAAAMGSLSPVGRFGLQPANCVGATMQRNLAISTVVAGTTQDLYLYACYLDANVTVSNITFVSGSTAAITPTNWWFTLADNALNMLAVTADQLTTAFGASSAFTLPVANVAAGAATSFVTTYTGIHYIGFMMKASTMPTLVGANASGTPVNNIAPKLAGVSSTTQTVPPTFPTAFTAITAAVGTAYAYLT